MRVRARSEHDLLCGLPKLAWLDRTLVGGRLLSTSAITLDCARLRYVERRSSTGGRLNAANGCGAAAAGLRIELRCSSDMSDLLRGRPRFEAGINWAVGLTRARLAEHSGKAPQRMAALRSSLATQ